MSIKNFDRLSKLFKFPLIRQGKDGSQIIVDKLQEKNADKAYEIFMKYAATGDGISVVSYS